MMVENCLNFASGGFKLLVNLNFNAFYAIFRVFWWLKIVKILPPSSFNFGILKYSTALYSLHWIQFYILKTFFVNNEEFKFILIFSQNTNLIGCHVVTKSLYVNLWISEV